MVARRLRAAVRAAQAHGDAESVPKGGEPEYRNGFQYRSVFGNRQGDMLVAHEKDYGYGPYANEPYRYVTIEKKVYSIRAWYQLVRHAPYACA